MTINRNPFSTLVAIILLSAPLLVSFDQPKVSCMTPLEIGDWVNIRHDRDAGIMRVVVPKSKWVCQDQIKNGKPYPPGPVYAFEFYGNCEPSYCEWGEERGDRLSSNYVHGVYVYSDYDIHVYFQAFNRDKSNPDTLYVESHYIQNDKTKKDFVLQDWLVRRERLKNFPGFGVAQPKSKERSIDAKPMSKLRVTELLRSDTARLAQPKP